MPSTLTDMECSLSLDALLARSILDEFDIDGFGYTDDLGDDDDTFGEED